LNRLHHGDCLEVMRGIADASVDSIVTDPPYGLSFMGKRWDYDVPSADIWRECLRVLKPGGHLLAFAGTRTQHRMAARIEDAGFEIRDMIAWVYGSGFPKSLDVSKAIDKAAGVEFDAVPASGVGFMNAEGEGGYNVTKNQLVRRGKSTAPARDWQGWGTALKPALEPITMARKPLTGSVAANVLQHGTGALNVDACRVATLDVYSYPNGAGGNSFSVGNEPDGKRTEPIKSNPLGRWPANLIHDGSDEVVGLFPQVKAGVAVRHNSGGNTFGGENPKPPMKDMGYGDSGSAARFFQKCAKQEDEKNNLEHFLQAVATPAYSDSNLESLLLTYQRQAKKLLSDNSDWAPPRFFYCAKANKADRGSSNNHPTVKPTALMRYLCRFVTPPSGTVLDPFMGSGSTGKAAVLEGFNFIGIEREAEYVEIAKARIAAAEAERGEMLPLVA
jgi:DNA modification methylase